MTMTPAPSLWSDTACPAPRCPALAGDTTADVVVVGGGYSGLSAALHLAEGGATVSLLEAAQPGFGASGRNGGQVNPGWYLDPDRCGGGQPQEALSARGPATVDAVSSEHALVIESGGGNGLSGKQRA